MRGVIATGRDRVPASAPMKRTLGLFVLVVAVGTACGGGGRSSSSSEPPTVDALASKIGCSNLDVTTSDKEMFVDGQAECQALDDTVNIRTFASDTTRDNWLDAARQFGGGFVVVHQAVVYGEAAATAPKIKAKIGGDVRS